MNEGYKRLKLYDTCISQKNAFNDVQERLIRFFFRIPRYLHLQQSLYVITL